MQIDMTVSAADLADTAHRVFEVAAGKVRGIYETRDPSSGAPVYTVAGPLHAARLDGVDGRLPVRLRATGVRRRRRRRGAA